ncbi:hypothetical protein BDW67DRAFT_189113 [Aspergillus spinulosporus]
MALQENGNNLLFRPPQRNPGRSRPDPEGHQIPPFSRQLLSSQTQCSSSCPVEQAGVSSTGLTCPRCCASCGHRPDCPQFNTIDEREAPKECERQRAVQKDRYEASLVSNKPVAAACGLSIRSVGSMSLPSSAWAAAVISSADDTPSLHPLRSTTATPATPSREHVPLLLADLRNKEVPKHSTLVPQHEDRFVTRHSSVIDRRPTPFASPDSQPSSPPGLAYCQPKSATNAGHSASTVTHRDKPFCDPNHRTPFELSPVLPSPDYSLTAPIKPTHDSEADPRLSRRLFSLLESPRAPKAARPSAPALHGSCSGPENLSTRSVHPSAVAPGPAQVPMLQPLYENRKRSFSAFSTNDSPFVSPSSRSSDAGSSLRHIAPYTKFFEPVSSKAALRCRSCLNECTQPRPPCPATDPRIPGTIDRMCISLPPAAMKMASQPKSPNTNSFAPKIAAATNIAAAWPPSSPPSPPALPLPVPGYVWTGSYWHGPFWTNALPAHIAADHDNGSARPKGASACAKAAARDDGGPGDYKSQTSNASNDDEDGKAAHVLANAPWMYHHRI